MNRESSYEKRELKVICSTDEWLYWFIAKNMFTAISADFLGLPYQQLVADKKVFDVACYKLIEKSCFTEKEKSRADGILDKIENLSLQFRASGQFMEW